MTEGKTIGELREEHGLTLEEMARDMQVSERDLRKLESSGQTYPGYNREWGVPVSELYGLEKVFWLEPHEAVREWKRVIDILQGLAVLAESMDSEPLLAVIGDAGTRARER